MVTGPQRSTYIKTATPAAIDQGLRSHMLRVYNYMAAGLAVTGILAYLASTIAPLTQFVQAAYLPLILVELGLVFYFAFRINKMSFQTAQIVFWVYAALNGLVLSSIFMVYDGPSIARVFFMTAGVFAGMSIYGYTTKRNLDSIGQFLFIGLIGIIIASLINLFIGSTALQMAVTIIGIVVFVGLTAYDTQKIKEMYLESDGTAVAGKKALMGALALYLDFINLFLMMLRLFGGNRE